MLMALICQSKQEQETMEKDPRDSDGDAKATLVVAPLSLLAQWEEEVETKTGLSFFLHYGDKKLEDYSAVDVVLTTCKSNGKAVTTALPPEDVSC
jgi:SNF2 family DNA or RNA helicase